MKALFLDLDGTVRRTKSGKPAPNKPEDQELLPGRVETLKDFKKQGYKIIAVTNQAGVALGHLSHDDVKACLADLDHKLGYVFDDMLYCASHPKSGDERRKPRPGIIHEAAKKHKIDLSQSIMVGDLESDREAAKNAGVAFEWAHNFFNGGADASSSGHSGVSGVPSRR